MKIYVAGLLAAVALGAALPASARSITGVSFTQSGATTTVDVTFEAGIPSAGRNASAAARGERDVRDAARDRRVERRLAGLVKK